MLPSACSHVSRWIFEAPDLLAARAVPRSRESTRTTPSVTNMISKIWLVGSVVLAAPIAVSAQTTPRPDVQITGEVRDDGFGRGIAAAGDVNADGFVDYIAGAGGDDDAGLGAGRAYLFYGPLTRDLSARNADAMIAGEADLDGFGDAVSSAGDVNRDGFDDVIVGARSNDSAGTQAGRAYLFYGPLAGSRSASSADAIISGAPFYELGWSVAGAGDVNADGFDDVVVGAWMADLVGRAFLFLGPISGPRSVADADASFAGVIFSEELGDAVGAGDLNNDGVPDLILGAPRPPLNGENPGRVYVFFGPVSGSFLATQADVILFGEQENDEFGTAVGAGDVDGDGADDLIVGAHQLFRDAPGRAYVFYGPLNGAISARNADAILVGEVSTPDEGDLFGESVASAGDTNGDGFDDVVVGASSNAAGGVRAGRVYLFHGPLFGTIQAAAADGIVTGSEFDQLGTSVAAARDADGDGLGDLLAGAPQFFGTNGFGFAALFLGEGTALTDLRISAVPVDPPIHIPGSGGTVRFQVTIVNRSAAAIDFDLWTELAGPGGSIRSSSPRRLTLDATASLTRELRLRIPGVAPPGTYTLRALVGTFPAADDSDSFTFVKDAPTGQ
jgi:hypothetical protein